MTALITTCHRNDPFAVVGRFLFYSHNMASNNIETEKYHIVYKTTNLINGKWYIGKHSTYNLNDGYLGSSKHLKSAIKKYGKHNFKREIICFCDSEEEAYKKEAEMVTMEVVKNPMTYNRMIGGEGGQKRCTDEELKEHHRESQHKWKEENRECVREISRKYYEANREQVLERNKAYYEANRYKVLEFMREYYEANRENIKAKKRAYREANLEKIKAKQRAWYKANRDKVLEHKKTYYEAKRTANKLKNSL